MLSFCLSRFILCVFLLLLKAELFCYAVQFFFVLLAALLVFRFTLCARQGRSPTEGLVT